jgi:ADP-ribose pyrophosphatase YjhB (NUDIX family)
MGLTRDFTVATFVVHNDEVLLLWHRKLQRWLPPGGHIEPNELPDEAAVREVAEETGVAVELVGPIGLPVERPRQLIRPAGVQVEDIAPDHQHIDLIYFARPVDPNCCAAIGNHESEEVGWFSRDAMRARDVTPEIQAWSERAFAEVGAWVVSEAR